MLLFFLLLFYRLGLLIRLKYFNDSLNIVLILALGREFFWDKCVQYLRFTFTFNIYGMKLNELHFSSGTVITHFLDKPYHLIKKYIAKDI